MLRRVTVQAAAGARVCTGDSGEEAVGFQGSETACE